MLCCTLFVVFENAYENNFTVREINEIEKHSSWMNQPTVTKQDQQKKTHSRKLAIKKPPCSYLICVLFFFLSPYVFVPCRCVSIVPKNRLFCLCISVQYYQHCVRLRSLRPLQLKYQNRCPTENVSLKMQWKTTANQLNQVCLKLYIYY